MKEKKLNLQEQANEIIRIAEESGVQSNFFFVTTFKRYQVQLNMLAELEKKLKKDGPFVTKTYIKGKDNLAASPALTEYNKTTDSANKTVNALLKIIKTFEVEKSEGEDQLMKLIKGL